LSEHIDVDVGEDLRLHVASSGEGPVLVLLHGFTGSTATWDFLRPALDSQYRVVAVDLPGHGRSSSPSNHARYSLDRFADDLATIFDSLDIENAAVLGYSMGGRAAIRFAIVHPQRIKALILESTSPGIADPVERAARINSDALLADVIEREGIEAFVALWEKLPLWQNQRTVSDAGRKALRAQRLANNARGLANSLRGAGAGYHDVLALAGSIASPTLLLAGELDTKYVELGRRTAAAIPHAELRIIPDTGHAIHLEKPEDFAAEVSAFLGTIPAA
jgi:2-succinyl-6-hydroxy-2,4-cyclohexadiene-1-carboxylate synthase